MTSIELEQATASTDVHDSLLSAREIANDIFRGTVSTQWVKRHVAPQAKLRLGHSTVRWWKRSVIEWISQTRIGP